MRVVRSLSILLTCGLLACTFVSVRANAAPDPSAAKLVQWNLSTQIGFGISSEMILGKPKLPSLQDARKKLSSHPNDPQLHIALAEVLGDQKYYDEAKTHYAKAADLYKAISAKRSLSVAEAVNYAKSLKRVKKTDEALAVAEKALSGAKKDTILLHRFLGEAYGNRVIPCLCGVEKTSSPVDISVALKSISDPAALKKNEDKANECARKAKLHLDAALKDPNATAEDYYERGAIDLSLQMAKAMARMSSAAQSDMVEEDEEEEESSPMSGVFNMFNSPYVLKALDMSKDPRAKTYRVMCNLLSTIGSAIGNNESPDQLSPETQKVVQDTKKALNDMVTGTKNPPASAYDWLASIGMMMNEDKEEIQKLACKALDLDPTLNNSFSIRVAGLLHEEKNLDEAIRRSKQKVSSDRSELGYRSLIIAYAKSGKLAEAQSALKEAQKLSVDKENTKDFQLIRGNLLILQNKPSEAIASLQSAVELDKANASAPISLAVAYYLQGMNVNAEQQLDIAKEHATTDGNEAIAKLRAIMAKN